MKVNLERWMSDADNEFLAHISLDCVIFGFHAGQLRILLLKMKSQDRLALPGGFMMQQETLEEAATRTLEERTGLEKIFLQQFHVFSDPARGDDDRGEGNPGRGDRRGSDRERGGTAAGMGTSRLEELKKLGMHPAKLEWLKQRFISVGFYALVEFSRVEPKPDVLSDTCDWYNLEDMGTLVLDHDRIVLSALAALRAQLNYQPIGYNLLPRKFTMPELQKLYETILGRKLDRRNFQRKILSYGILTILDEKRTGVAHKAPYLYSFHLRNYHKALKLGLQGGW